MASKGPRVAWCQFKQSRDKEGKNTMEIATLEIALAKTVFQLVELDEKWHEVMNKKVIGNYLAATVWNLPHIY